MHKYLRAAGFSMYQKNRDIKALLKCLSKEPKDSRCIQIDRDTDFYELRAEIADGIGISMCGEMNDRTNWKLSITILTWRAVLRPPQLNAPFRDTQRRRPTRDF